MFHDYNDISLLANIESGSTGQVAHLIIERQSNHNLSSSNHPSAFEAFYQPTAIRPQHQGENHMRDALFGFRAKRGPHFGTAYALFRLYIQLTGQRTEHGTERGQARASETAASVAPAAGTSTPALVFRSRPFALNYLHPISQKG